MARIQSEIDRSQVVTAKCSEPQVVDSDVRDGGSGVAILSSVRTETGYKAKWWIGCSTNRSPKGKRKTKTVNPDVVKETGFVNYPGRSCGRWSPISLKAVLVTSVEKGLPQEVS